jgi:hypothetical protein
LKAMPTIFEVRMILIGETELQWESKSS